MKDSKGRPTRKALALRKWDCWGVVIWGVTSFYWKDSSMPKVGKMEFPYTAKGMADAKKAKKKMANKAMKKKGKTKK